MLQNLRCDDAVEGAVSEGKGERVATSDAHVGLSGQLTSVTHGSDRAEYAFYFGGTKVECHHLSAAAGGLVGVATESATHVEQHITWTHLQELVASGQHAGSSVPGSGSPASKAS